MEASNKENIRVHEKSKNAVLKDGISSRLTSKDDETQQNALQARDPLKTISNQNYENSLAGTSQKINNKLDTRFVTYRRNNEEFSRNREFNVDKTPKFATHPKKTLQTRSNQKVKNCLAGPSQKINKVLDTRFVTLRTTDEELDWNLDALRDNLVKTCNIENIEHGRDAALKVKPVVHAKTPAGNSDGKDLNCKLEIKDDEAPQNTFHPRDSLKAVTYQNVKNCLAGPTQKINNELVTRFVTLRSTDEELDSNLDLLRDNLVEICSIENNDHGTDDALKTCPVVHAETPAGIVTLERVNKSNSTSSRGLQQATSTFPSKTNANCSSYNIEETVVYSGLSFEWHLNQGYALSILRYLLEIEKKNYVTCTLRKTSRSCIINWLISVNGSSGNAAVVQLASWYLDHYSNTSWVPNNNLQVTAAACFWIASKFCGRSCSGRRLVKCSDHAFALKKLAAAEIKVIRKLNFQAQQVVPHDFVPYLSWCCDQSGSGVVEAAATFLCQCSTMVDNLLAEEYPSVVATAAVMNALVLLGQSSWTEKLKECPIYMAVVNKAVNLNDACNKLLDAVRLVSSEEYEYTAPLWKFSCPPHFITQKITTAINLKDSENK